MNRLAEAIRVLLSDVMAEMIEQKKREITLIPREADETFFMLHRNIMQDFVGSGSNVQKCRKICGLGCVNQARTRARVTQPSPRIFLHICRSDIRRRADANKELR